MYWVGIVTLIYLWRAFDITHITTTSKFFIGHGYFNVRLVRMQKVGSLYQDYAQDDVFHTFFEIGVERR